MIPEDGEYLMNIMKKMGFKCRDAILRLKNDDILQKMFKEIQELQGLIPAHERQSMFGMFEKDPSLLRVLSGVRPGFDRFLKKVEELIPEETTKSSSKRRKAVSQNLSTVNTNSDPSKASSETPVGKSLEQINENFRQWFTLNLPALSPDTSVDDAKLSFTLERNSDGSFKYKCKGSAACGVITITNLGPTKTNIGHATRHMSKSCWLSPNPPKKINKTAKLQKSISSFCIKPSLVKQDFVPGTNCPINEPHFERSSLIIAPDDASKAHHENQSTSTSLDNAGKIVQPNSTAPSTSTLPQLTSATEESSAEEMTIKPASDFITGLEDNSSDNEGSSTGSKN